jgi:hypothetical protein
MAATGPFAGVPSRHLSTFFSRSSIPCHASANFGFKPCGWGSVASGWALDEVGVVPRPISWMRSVRSIQRLSSSDVTMITFSPSPSTGPVLDGGTS